MSSKHWIIIGIGVAALAVGVVVVLLWPSSASASTGPALLPGSDGGPTGRAPAGGASEEDLSDITWDGTDEDLEEITS